MSGVENLIADLVDAGVSAELVGRVAAALAAREPIIVNVGDEQAERRRTKDRERKAEIRRNRQMSAESADIAEPQKETSPTPPIRKTTSSLRSDLSSARDQDRDEFFAFVWSAIPKRRGDAPKPARKALMAALNAGVDPEVIRDGVRRYAASEKGADPQYRKGAAVWINAAGWEADYTQQLPRAGPHRQQENGYVTVLRELGALPNENPSPDDNIIDITPSSANADDGGFGGMARKQTDAGGRGEIFDFGDGRADRGKPQSASGSGNGAGLLPPGVRFRS